MHRPSLRVLGLAGPKATPAEVKEAYRLQAKRWHPDVAHVGSTKVEAESKFLEIKAAYETLCGPQMSDAARKLTRPPKDYRKEELRRYHAETSGTPIKVMMAVLLGLTGYTAYDMHGRKRMPYQQEHVSELWRKRKT